ncbi:MAG: Si-specific NAD(P)(+) transhydrogenase [Solirubrobacteraceae bacterium]
MDLDLLVIGSGPSGQKAAIQAAKLGKRVAVVERRQRLGGVSIRTGTMPSQTLRAAVLDELARRPLDVPDPLNPDSRERAAIEFLMDRTARVVGAEAQVVREQFRRNRVGLLFGEGHFVDEHTVCVCDEENDDNTFSAENIVIAVGTNPARPQGVEFDDETVIDSDGLLQLHRRLPRTMTIVGAGVIGVEYASMFGRLGTKVTVVDQRPRLLTFLDGEIGEALQFILRRNNVTFRLTEKVSSVLRGENGVVTHLESGKAIPSETVLYATGRQGATEALALETVGLEADERGRIVTDDEYRTKVPHIFAVGDVGVGGFGLAATAMEQGRLAALHAFGKPVTTMPELMPTGVYAIPEISMVGRTEEDLTEAAVPYVTGIARWSELARGLMTGDEDGMLKLLVSTNDRRLLGVHVLGTSAADLVHIGQAVMGGNNTVDFLVSAVFNYPTFAEAYKVAALDAVNRMV